MPADARPSALAMSVLASSALAGGVITTPPAPPMTLPETHHCAADQCGHLAAMRMQALAELYARTGELPAADADGNARIAFIPETGPVFTGASLGSRAIDDYADTDVLHNDIDITVNISARTLSGSNTMTITSLVDGLDMFTYRLRSQYSASATVDGTPATSTTVDTVTRRVTLPRTYNAGETFTLRIDYSGDAVSRGFGSIEFTSLGSQTLVATLSQPYFAYTWWPCKDSEFGEPGDTSDKATVELSVTAPTAYTLATNGEFVSRTTSGGQATTTYQTNYPTATYLVSFALHPYRSFNETWNWSDGTQSYSMPAQFLISPSSDSTNNRNAWRRSVDMLTTFSNLVGVYPFHDEKYGIYEFSFGGGMEHQTNSGQGTFNESVTAHELAHQWFGDFVTCRTWSDLWLNEGWASYGETLWEEFKSGTSNPAARASAIAARVPGDITYSAYRYDTSDVNDLFSASGVYHRGGWALHMLRYVIGDDAFFQTARDWLAIYGGSSAGTEDFRALAEANSGKDLERFFNQWVYNGGYPEYTIQWNPVSVAGEPYLGVRVTQTPQATAPAAFDQPVPVRINGVDDVRLEVSKLEQYFLVPLSSTAGSLTIDPENWLLAAASASQAFTLSLPPKVVAVSPAPNTEAEPTDAITITLSSFTTAPGGAVLLTRDGTTVIPATQSTSGDTITLTPNAPLEPGAYTITALDSIANGSLALDGEAAFFEPGATASGDGTPGGAFVSAFTIPAGGCNAADLAMPFDTLNFADVQAFLGSFGAGLPEADLAAPQGTFNFADVQTFLGLFGTGC